MKIIYSFIKDLVKEFNEKELIYISNELSYKILLSSFPFFIYLVNMITFFGIKHEMFKSTLVHALPSSVLVVLSSLLNSVNTFAESNNFSSIMNLTLIIAVLSSSSGFSAIMRGINKTYGVKDERSFIHKTLISILFVFIFSFSLIISATLLVFNDVIFSFLNFLGLNIPYLKIFDLFKYIVSIIIVLLNVIFVYKISSFKKISFKSTIPGAIITVIAWILSSLGFNLYINNFSKYNTLYGVIGSFIIFILWINIIALVLLVGSQINALMDSKIVTK